MNWFEVVILIYILSINKYNSILCGEKAKKGKIYCGVLRYKTGDQVVKNLRLMTLVSNCEKFDN